MQRRIGFPLTKKKGTKLFWDREWQGTPSRRILGVARACRNLTLNQFNPLRWSESRCCSDRLTLLTLGCHFRVDRGGESSETSLYSCSPTGALNKVLAARTFAGGPNLCTVPNGLWALSIRAAAGHQGAIVHAPGGRFC
jgi:hypothetical protein